MSLPATMTVVEITRPGGPEVLRPVSAPVPQPGKGEVLIEVAAAGVNRPDVMQREGKYPPPPGASEIPGLEVSGRIVALGDDVEGWSVGDRCAALVAGGGYATYCVAPALQCLPIPSGIEVEEMAGVPETFFTVWANVFELGRFATKATLLCHGGASGIGTTAIQLVKAYGGRIVVTAGSDDKCQKCLDLGADRAINYKTKDFVTEVEHFTDGEGVDVVLDMVGGDYVARNMACLARNGRHVTIAFLHGPDAQISLAPIMLRNITLTGSTLRRRPVEEKGRLARALKSHVWPWFTDGVVKPIVSHRFKLSEAQQAHEALERGDHFGKIILLPD
ncbi:MAG: NAD(P)H-quinone oxidoreductase [Myxococcota bacterium]